MSAQRNPEFTGPYCGASDWNLFNGSGSGVYIDLFSMVVAADGSFVVTNPMVDGLTSEWVRPSEYSLLWFNRLTDTNPLDPYGFALCSSNGDSTCLTSIATTWNNIWSIHPDGTQVQCSASMPSVVDGSALAAMHDMNVDDPERGWKPLCLPIRIVSTTAGYESYKGTLEDMWVGSRYIWKWGQPGFVGEDMKVAQKGLLWSPCLEPWRY
jgi:hypothetical protein